MDGIRSQEPDDSLGADPAERLMVDLLALPEGEREAALEQACAREPALASELRARWKALRDLGLAGGAPALTSEGFPESLGDFDLLERLGAGGMGVVYRARQRSLGREVALKVLRPEALYFERSRERFRREAAAVAALRHPGIVPVHAAGETRGVPWFAMERIEGETLAELLARLRGRAPQSLTGADLSRALGPPSAAPTPELFALDWDDACAELARQVAEALEHAHARGILHRDVKPSNVALTRDGRAQLFDFGLAMSLEGERLTLTGGTLGTLHYMSPEHVRGAADFDARSDVYSLGVTLYELLALEVPFAGATRAALEARILAGRAAPLRELNPRASRELALVCAKAMELDPARRYASARDFADDLAAVLRRRPVSARAPTVAYRVQRWLRRNPALASAGVAAFGLFGVAPSVLLWRERAHASALSQAYAEESRALDAERAALEAERRASAEASDSLDFLESLFHAASPYESGNADQRVRDLLRRGPSLLEELKASPSLEGRLALKLASAMAVNALPGDATPLAERALALEQELGIELETRDSRPAEVLAMCMGMTGRADAAVEILEQSLARTTAPKQVARQTLALGRLLALQGRSEEALQCYRAALEFYGEKAAEHREPRMSLLYAMSEVVLGLGRPYEALELAEAGLVLADELVGPEHPVYAQGLTRFAYALVELDLCEPAGENIRRAAELTQAFFGRSSVANLRAREDLAVVLKACGELEGAAEAALEAAELCTKLFGAAHPRCVDAQARARDYAAAARRR